jgi:hypothetical protein
MSLSIDMWKSWTAPCDGSFRTEKRSQKVHLKGLFSQAISGWFFKVCLMK